MIDLHSHIIAGIDDGARTIDDSLALAEHSVEQGVTHMVCTPHINARSFKNNKQTIAKAFHQTHQAIVKAKIPLKLSAACEYRLTGTVTDEIEQNKLPFLGRWHKKTILLLELPHSHIPPGVENVIRWLLQRNIQPVIPHPERNREILQNYAKAKWLKQQGCVFQLTAGALIGRFSEQSEKMAWKMLDDKLVSYVASDLHNLRDRPNDMLLACKAVKQHKGEALAMCLFKQIPEQITVDTNWR